MCGLSLVAEIRGYSLFAVFRLPIAVASLVAKHELYGAWVAAVVAHGLSCPVYCGIFPDQGLNPSLLHWQADS